MLNPSDPTDFKSALGRFASGIVIVTGVDELGEPVGLTCQSFCAVSLEPPLVGFFAEKEGLSWSKIKHDGRFGISVLNESQTEVSSRFATRGEDKFSYVNVEPMPSGLKAIEHALVWLDCEVTSVLDAGDHDCVVGKVVAMGTSNDKDSVPAPLIYFQGRYTGLK